jgi:glycosyltransferase involved in cell wall biosynthesis
MARARLILMLGPSLEYPGGMTEVARLYRSAGMFERWPLRHVATYSGRAGMFRTWIAAVWTTLWLLFRKRVVLLHVHSAAYGSFWRKSVLCALAYAFRVPYVFHLHDGRFPVFFQGSRLARAFIKWVFRHASRVVVLTPRWRDVVHAIEPAARIAVIGNPVSVPGEVAKPEREARTVLFLGWLQREKGVFDLVQAMPAVLRAVPQARFVLAGRGDRAALLSLARSLGVEEALELPGWVEGDRKDQLLRAADVFVLPSYYEGLPVGVMEAMARGIPVVATRVGGIPDLVAHGVSGLLLEPGRPAALAQAIVSVLTDATLRARLREAAHREVRCYSTDAVVAELEALYRKLNVCAAS